MSVGGIAIVFELPFWLSRSEVVCCAPLFLAVQARYLPPFWRTRAGIHGWVSPRQTHGQEPGFVVSVRNAPHMTRMRAQQVPRHQSGACYARKNQACGAAYFFAQSFTRQTGSGRSRLRRDEVEFYFRAIRVEEE